MSTKISVIVPVYNAELFIIPCLDSILNQSIESLELICVNDGSTDHSLQVLYEYQKAHANAAGRTIKIIDQPNGGPSKARNTGLCAASGDYIGFVDCDDFVEPEMYKSLIQIAESMHLNAVLCGILNIYADGRCIKSEEKAPVDRLMQKKDILKYICPTLMQEDVFGGPCNRIYRRSFLREHEIGMPENLGYGEDAVFQMRVFDFLDKVWIVSDTFYHYIHRDGSQSSAKPGRFFHTLEPLYEIRCTYGEKWKIPKSVIANYFVYCTIMDMIATLRNKEFRGKRAYLRNVYSNCNFRNALGSASFPRNYYTPKIYLFYRLLKVFSKNKNKL